LIEILQSGDEVMSELYLICWLYFVPLMRLRYITLLLER
jgi:hypothetical protein